MTPLGAMLWAKQRITRHLIASVRDESKLKVSFVSVAALGLWIGIFALSRGGFRLLSTFGRDLLGAQGGAGLTDLLMVRLLAAFALALFLMLILSNVLIAFMTLYRAQEMTFLLLRPISTSTLFLGRFAECVTLSSWAAGYLGLPVLIAYGLERGAPLFFYAALPIFFAPFVVIPAALGAGATILLVRFVAPLRRGAVITVAVAAIGALFVLIRQRMQMPDFANTATVQAIFEALGRSQSPYLPSFWIAEGLLRAAAGDGIETLFYLLLLVANALLLVLLATRAAERWLYTGWSSLKSNGPPAVRHRRGAAAWLDLVLRPLPPELRALLAKDVMLFWRDPAQWSQFVLFFGIMALYIANLRSSTIALQARWQGWITLLNLSACLLILATLTTRFIFPLISLEGRRRWLLGLAPITLRQVMAQKLLLSIGSLSLFTVGLTVLSAIQLRLAPLPFLLSVFGIAAATVGLSGLAVGLGSLYPRFEEDNPARIVSGLGGTLNFLLSVVFVVLVATAQAVVVQWPLLAPYLPAVSFRWVCGGTVIFIALLSIATAWVPMVLGRRNLERSAFGAQ